MPSVIDTRDICSQDHSRDMPSLVVHEAIPRPTGKSMLDESPPEPDDGLGAGASEEAAPLE